MKCKTCKKLFDKRTVDKRDKNKYCSSRCALAPCRTKEHQISAGKKAGQVIIKKYRGTGTKGYIRELSDHQHRLVAEKILGRELKKGEIVHHKDNNKHNNNPNNLEVMTQAEHARLHYLLSGGQGIKNAILKNTKYGPKCLFRSCKLPNKKGRAYCPHHQWICVDKK